MTVLGPDVNGNLHLEPQRLRRCNPKSEEGSPHAASGTAFVTVSPSYIEPGLILPMRRHPARSTRFGTALR